MSQCDAILKHLKSGNTLTALEAFAKFDCMRLAARIENLRANNKIITTIIETASGKRVAQYSIGGK